MARHIPTPHTTHTTYKGPPREVRRPALSVDVRFRGGAGVWFLFHVSGFVFMIFFHSSMFYSSIHSLEVEVARHQAREEVLEEEASYFLSHLPALCHILLIQRPHARPHPHSTQATQQAKPEGKNAPDLTRRAKTKTCVPRQRNSFGRPIAVIAPATRAAGAASLATRTGTPMSTPSHPGTTGTQAVWDMRFLGSVWEARCLRGTLRKRVASGLNSGCSMNCRERAHTAVS